MTLLQRARQPLDRVGHVVAVGLAARAARRIGGDLARQVLGRRPATRAFISRSRSASALSRSAWRFCASRISGAAYAAWVENARFSRMNGYGIPRAATRPQVERDPDDHERSSGRPGSARCRGSGPSARRNRANASGSYDGPPGVPRGVLRSSSARHQRLATRDAPVRREHPVEHVVDRNRADEAPGVVGDRDRDDVVGGEPLGHLAIAGVGRDRLPAPRRGSAPSGLLGASRSRRWMPTTPRKRPVGVSSGGRQTNTWAASGTGRSGSRTGRAPRPPSPAASRITGSGVIRPPAVSGL